MKTRNKWTGLLALLFAAILLVTGNHAITAKAVQFSVRDTFPPRNYTPKRIRIRVDSAFNHAMEAEYDGAVHVENIKTYSKKFKAFNTQTLTAYRNNELITEIDMGFYALKAGKYKVTFDIVKEDGSREKKKIMVYAYDDYPIKKITFGGKQIPYPALDEFPRMNYPAKGKFKVTMTPGYKLVRIEKISYKHATKENGEIETVKDIKKVKNGSSVALSNVAYKVAFKFYGYEVSSHEMNAQTKFRIYYKDKYSKTLEYRDFVLYKLVNYEK
ncbi:hypothetical protein [Butyrivibrio sp. MB2005]|uniref:hypothetical protein n=1 Tax=Butyrivibrio sp. MB2005 TaxID=1280678 RepID=UPI00047CAE50|nr:hypothetical protein [Butyrivibrio sp. MB2005]